MTTVVATVLLGGAALVGCVAPVRVDYNSAAELARCHRFAWQDGAQLSKAGAFQNPLNAQRLRDAVAVQLQAHGVVPVTGTAAPDCIVQAVIGSREDPDEDPYEWGPGWGPGWGERRWDWDSSPYFYRVTRLSVDLYDARTHEPLWHASIDSDVSGLTGSRAQARIDGAVHALFAHYPVGAGKGA